MMTMPEPPLAAIPVNGSPPLPPPPPPLFVVPFTCPTF